MEPKGPPPDPIQQVKVLTAAHGAKEAPRRLAREDDLHDVAVAGDAAVADALLDGELRRLAYEARRDHLVEVR